MYQLEEDYFGGWMPADDMDLRRIVNVDSWQARGLIAWYPGGPALPGVEVTGLRDYSLYNGGSVPGNLTFGGTTPPAWLKDPLYGWYPSFDGATSSCESLRAAATAAPFTITAWFNIPSATASKTIACLGSSGGGGTAWELTQRGANGNVLRWSPGSAPGAADTTTVIPLGVWNFGAGIEVGPDNRWVVLNDAQAVQNTTSVTPTAALIDRTEVGSRMFNGTRGQFWLGGVRDVRFYNRALNLNEIRALYNPATRFDLWAPRASLYFSLPAAAPVTGNLFLDANLTGLGSSGPFFSNPLG